MHLIAAFVFGLVHGHICLLHELILADLRTKKQNYANRCRAAVLYRGLTLG